MRYVSLFAGIEAASQGWHHMGWEPVAFADIDQFPSTVLAHHYPEVPNLGNVEEVDWNEYRGKADLVVGGSPCQSFSVAGRRLGLDDPRGNLALEFLRAVKEIQPTWFVFENVPGLLSSDEGRDFGIFLGQVAQIGYGFAYRVLDSQYFGVPQRRRRVFVVGHIGNDWRSAASVLFERESLQGHSKESKAQGKAITEYIGTSTSQQGEPGRRVIPKITGTIDTDCGGGKLSVQHASSGHLIPETEPIAFEQNQRSEVRETEVAGPVKAEKGSNNQTFIAQNWDGEDKTGTLTTRSMDQFMPDKDNFMAVVEPTPDSEIFDSWALNENPRNVSPTLNASLPYTSGDPIVTEPEIFDETNPNGRTDVSPTLNARDSGSTGDPIVHETIGFDWKNAAQTNFDKKNSGAPVTAEGGLAVGQPIVSPTLTSHNLDSRSPQSAESTAIVGKVLDASKHKSMAVRRLTPVECERLQGFPDNYTQIAWKGKAPEDCPDGPRYKALGNSMAVPVMRWIGEGIQIVDDLVRGLDERADSKTTEQKSLFDF